MSDHPYAAPGDEQAERQSLIDQELERIEAGPRAMASTNQENVNVDPSVRQYVISRRAARAVPRGA